MALEDEHRPKKIATPVSYLPSEIINDILSRLPVKSLLRFKSLCKLWHSLISDPCFIKSHLSMSACNVNFAHHRLIISNLVGKDLNSYSLCDLFKKSVNKLGTCFPLELSRMHPYLRVIGSCNGLLCILDERTMIIYNPSTRIWSQFYIVPWGMLYGFGYDESSDDYKVVVITLENHVEIFSLKTGTWKRKGKLPHNVYQLHCSCKFANGALHWAGHNGESGSLNSWTIISFDLAKETYGEVLQPVYDKGEKELRLGALGQCLCVACGYRDDRVDLWVMKVYGVKDSWTILASIPYLPDYGRFDQCVVPLCISDDGKVLLQSKSKLVVYNTHNSTSTEIPSLGVDGFTKICIVVESFVSPRALLRRKRLRSRRASSCNGWMGAGQL